MPQQPATPNTLGVFFEGSDGPELRQNGWRKLLEQLGTELASNP
jgi:hypothetical protein